MSKQLSAEVRMWSALKRMASYESPERLHKTALKHYGLNPDEAIEMAYENLIGEAKAAIKGLRKPKGIAS